MNIEKFLVHHKGGMVKPLSPLRPILEMEDAQSIVRTMPENGLLEITVTFKPCLTMQWGALSLADITETQIRRSIRGATDNAMVILIGEYSAVGRWHYHGMISGVGGDIISKLKRGCSRNLGRTEIKQITYRDSYEKYMFDSYTIDHPKVSVKQTWENQAHVTINCHY